MEKAPVDMSSLSRAAALAAERVWKMFSQLRTIGMRRLWDRRTYSEGHDCVV